MGRQEKPLDAAAGPVEGFAFALRKLRQEAGGPTYQAMARRGPYSVATLSRAAGGEQLPTLPVVLAYVAACGGAPAEWEARWRLVSGELSTARAAERAEEPSPYRGLARFEPDDHALFFGRDRLIDDLALLTTRHRVVTVFGASGSGKSSLLRAGLIPRLRDAGSPGLPRPGAIRILTPGEDPLATHGSALVPADTAGDTWLVVDQFEELFTLCHDEAERTRFVDALLAAGDPAGRLRVVLGVRADFYARCLDHAGLAAAVRDASLPVGRMAPAELRQAITKPAAACGLLVERALTEALVEEVATLTAGLPMLSHALLETWRGRRGRTLTLEAYERAGGMRGAIAQSAEAAYEAMDPRQAGTARQVMLRLITPGDGAPDTRRPTTRAELEAVGDSRRTSAVLEILARARLITLDEDTVDLAHETLITAWPRLNGWIEADREKLRLHRWLTEAAGAWESVGRDPGVRIPPVRLTQLRDVASADGRSELTPLEAEFLAAGTATHRRTVRRRRTARATISLLTVLAFLAGTVAWQQNRSGRDRRLLTAALHAAAVADSLRATDPDTAARLGLAAWSMARTPETKAALYAAHTHRAEPDIEVATGDVQRQSAWLGPDGTTLTLHKELEVERWDLRTRRRVSAHKVPGAPKPAPPLGRGGLEGVVASGPLQPSPDGQWAASTWQGGAVDGPSSRPAEIRLWNLTADSGTYDTIVRENASEVTSTSWGDGSRLLAAAVRGRAEVWDVRSRKLVFAADAAENGDAVALSPDGGRLALCAGGGAVEVWDVARHEKVTAPDPHLLRIPGGACPAGTLHFGPDGRMLALKLAAGVQLIDLEAEAGRSRDPIAARDVTDISFSSDGAFLAGLRKDAVLLWRTDDHRGNALVFSQLLPNEMPSNVRFDAAEGKLRYLRAGTLGVATIALDQALRTPWARFSADPVLTSPDGTHTITMRGEGKEHSFEQRPAVGSAPGPGVRLPSLSLPAAPPEGVTDLALGAFSPDGTLFAYGPREAQGSLIRLWDVRGQRALPVLPVPYDAIVARTVSALAPVRQNGTTAVYTILSGDLSILVELMSGQQIVDFPNGPSTMAVRPDGKLLVLGGGTVVRLPEGRVERAASQRELGLALAFSGDGSLFAIADGVGRVTLWDGDLTQRLGVLDDGLPSAAGEPVPITALGFSPDGGTLATGDALGRIRLWDVESRKALGTALLGPGDEVRDLAFERDGLTLRSQGRNTPPLRHSIAPEAVAASLCSRLGGGLDRAQWRARIREAAYRETCPRTTRAAR